MLFRWCVRPVVYGPRGNDFRSPSEDSSHATRSLLQISVYLVATGTIGATIASLADLALWQKVRRVEPSAVRSHRSVCTAAHTPRRQRRIPCLPPLIGPPGPQRLCPSELRCAFRTSEKEKLGKVEGGGSTCSDKWERTTLSDG